MLYQVETKALNQAVKRNIKRFPEDFCFQLTAEEFEFLKGQFGTSKILNEENSDRRGGRCTLPFVFTELEWLILFYDKKKIVNLIYFLT